MLQPVNLRMNTPMNRPPVYTAIVDLVDWSLERTAGLPRSHRFTFGERVDRLTLDCLELVIAAVYATGTGKGPPLRRLNLTLEKLRVFWRLICDRRWISQRQLLFVSTKLDEIGRMTGGWLKQIESKTGGP
jgi:hypothetical protein